MSIDIAAPKGITALDYRDALGTDFSNQGISARVTEVTVIGEGIDPVFEATEERAAVRLVKNEHFHREAVIHAEPVTPEGEPVPWYMFGGTFIFSSDSRFRRAAGHYGRGHSARPRLAA
ncbi:hypothetical protein [Pseudarthrobacter sp. NPDC080039]|uniref:hypothetical protein n=1 Tax=unclassified Pseudarthrobacter TaxID=2647000 RepID=UPI00344C9E3E